jgi:hypothetical protein
VWAAEAVSHDVTRVSHLMPVENIIDVSRPVARESQVDRLAINVAAHYATGLQLDSTMSIELQANCKVPHIMQLACNSMVELKASCQPVASQLYSMPPALYVSIPSMSYGSLDGYRSAAEDGSRGNITVRKHYSRACLIRKYRQYIGSLDDTPIHIHVHKCTLILNVP